MKRNVYVCLVAVSLTFLQCVSQRGTLKSASNARIWSALTDFDSVTIQLVKRDPNSRNLMRLALLFNGIQTEQELRPLMQRYESFLQHTGKKMASTQPSLRGKVLLEEMHTYLLGTIVKPYKVRYRHDQARMDVLLRKGTYNCLSSSVLYGIAARHFGLKVRGVFIDGKPGHAFIQLLNPSRKGPLFVETTTYRGYGKTHDKAFYDNWKRRHVTGLSKDGALIKGEPPTFQAFQQRKTYDLLSTVVSMSFGNHRKRFSPSYRNKLNEIAGLFGSQTIVQRNRLISWHNIYVERIKMKPITQRINFFREIETVLPYVLPFAKGHPKTRRILGFLYLYQVKALSNGGRYDEAIEPFRKAFDVVKQGGYNKPAKLRKVAYGMTKGYLFRSAKFRKTQAAEQLLAEVKQTFPKWYPYLSAFYYRYAGSYLLRYRDFDGAFRLFQLCKDTPVASLRTRCVEGLARTHAKRGHRWNGMRHFQKALQDFLACTRYPSSIKILCRNNAGVAYSNLAAQAIRDNDRQKAAQYYAACQKLQLRRNTCQKIKKWLSR